MVVFEWLVYRNGKIMDYPSTEYLKQLKEWLPVYYAHLEKVKPKRLVQIESVYHNFYDLQYDALPVINELEVSHLLGCNEVVIPVMEEEWDRLAVALLALKNGGKTSLLKTCSGLKGLKPFGELMQNMKPLTNLLNKDLEVMKRKDVAHLCRTFGLVTE